MELRELARGPALTFAITVFIAGTVFRIVSLIFMWRTKDSSEGSPREQPAFVAAIKELARRMWPLPTYRQRSLFQLINGYVFHIWLAIIVFLLLPHILFIEDLTGDPVSADALASRVNMTADDALAEAHQRLDKMKEIPEYTAPVSLGAQVRVVHGNETVAKYDTDFAAASTAFSDWLGRFR